MQLVDKEALHLEQIRHRFFEEKDTITPEWLQEKLKTAIGIDQLESFSAKFSRLQDTLGDKLLPLFLKLTAEPIGTAIENLNRAEKLGLIMDTGQWLGARQLRNFLVHEHIHDLIILLESLEKARIMSTVLINTANAIKHYFDQIADGDEMILSMSGFHPTKQPVPHQKPLLSIFDGSHPGSALLTAKAHDKAGAYIWQLVKGPLPTSESEWKLIAISTQASYEVEELEVGVSYYFGVAVVTPEGTTEFCQPVLKLIV